MKLHATRRLGCPVAQVRCAGRWSASAGLILTGHKVASRGPFMQLATESMLIIAPPRFRASTRAKARAMRSRRTKFTSNCSRNRPIGEDAANRGGHWQPRLNAVLEASGQSSNDAKRVLQVYESALTDLERHEQRLREIRRARFPQTGKKD